MTQQEREAFERKYFENSIFYKRMGYEYGDLIPEERIKSPVKGIQDMSTQLKWQGGYYQQNRMIQDKRKSLERAMVYSYQAAFIQKVGNEDSPPVRALINPDKVKQDYDEKILSTGYENEVAPGDIFEWVNTRTYWLVYLQDTTELAYFRANIRKCSYQIQWLDDEGNVLSTYCALRGPVETQINYIQKHTISIDTPNYSLNILMPKNKETLTFFKRYAKFYLTGLEDGDTNVCWRVEAVDSLSMPGVLEVNAEEYYMNESEDDGITAGSLIAKPIDTNSDEINELIEGEVFIKPKKEYQYHFTGLYRDDWSVDKKYPVRLKSLPDKTVSLIWDSSYCGQFELSYGQYTKTIVVESLF